MANSWLQSEHPIYTKKKDEWRRMELRLRAGSAILSELRPFDWEVGQVFGLDPTNRGAERAAQDTVSAMTAAKESGTLLGTELGSHYTARQNEAIYINFPQSFASILIGHIFAKAPIADDSITFGNLGQVKRAANAVAASRAELIWYNADGAGMQGSQWNNWWQTVAEWAMATGHRWNMVEATRQAGQFRDAEIFAGLRPYLISYSPLAVKNWHDVEGRLEFAMLSYRYRDPQLERGQLIGNEWALGTRLMTAAGVDRFGKEFAGGGWWDFDKDGELLDGQAGNWDFTGGAIPMWMHYYMRDTEEISRSGLFELSQAAIAYMNVDSAASYDFWDACSSLKFLLGVSKDAFNLAMSKLRDGSRYIPVPGDKNSGAGPTVSDGSQGAVTGDVADKRLERIRISIREAAALEASGSPESSGLSKMIGFKDAKSPRLLTLASEMETSQNTAIYYLEKRNGFKRPFGSVKWPREYDLAPLMDKLLQYLEMQDKAGVISPTLTSRALRQGAESVGLTTDDEDSTKIELEILTELSDAKAQRAQRDALLPGFLPGTDQPPALPAPAPTPEPAVPAAG